MKNAFKLICFCLLLSIFNQACAQEAAPFQQDIEAFRQQDKLQPPPQQAIVFVGSSSFTKWTDVQQYFPGYTIINRGFGGSSLPDVIHYAADIIYPYHPKQVVIYCGDNDFAGNENLPAVTVVERVKELFKQIRQHLPKATITYISIKPSPSRARFMPKMETANKAIKEFLATYTNTGFIDVYHAMLRPDGKPIPAIFLSDSLHMNSQGYAIWKKTIEPALKK